MGDPVFLHPRQHWVSPLFSHLALPCGGRGWPTPRPHQQRASGQFAPTHGSTGVASLFNFGHPSGLQCCLPSHCGFDLLFPKEQ